MHTDSLLIGGLVAMGFDPSGRYLLAVSHSGRGVFDTTTWQRVARDAEVHYPDNDQCEGIGPLAGQMIAVTEIDYKTGHLTITHPATHVLLSYREGTVTITPPPVP